MSKIKYGLCDNKEDLVLTKGAFGASKVLPAKSGRFVIYDISDGYWKGVANDTTAIGGYLEQSLTTSTSAGATVLPIIDVKGRTFELPYAAAGAAATLTEAVLATLIGKLIDIYVDANSVQYADNAANQAIFRVEGGDVAENTLKVSIIDSAITQIA